MQTWCRTGSVGDQSAEYCGQRSIRRSVVGQSAVRAVHFDVLADRDRIRGGGNDRVVSAVDLEDLRPRAEGPSEVNMEGASTGRHVAISI